MRKTGIFELIKYLHYMGMLTPFRILEQLKTRYLCAKKHNKWVELSLLHGAGKYVYTGFRCNKCSAIHYEFNLNKTK